MTQSSKIQSEAINIPKYDFGDTVFLTHFYSD